MIRLLALPKPAGFATRTTLRCNTTESGTALQRQLLRGGDEMWVVRVSFE